MLCYSHERLDKLADLLQSTGSEGHLDLNVRFLTKQILKVLQDDIKLEEYRIQEYICMYIVLGVHGLHNL